MTEKFKVWRQVEQYTVVYANDPSAAAERASESMDWTTDEGTATRPYDVGRVPDE